MPPPRNADVARACGVLEDLELVGNNRISHLHFEDGAETHPLYLWERVEFVNERSEFTNSGEGKTLSRIAKIRSRSLSNSTLSQGERRFVNSLSWERGKGECSTSFAKQTEKNLFTSKKIAFTKPSRGTSDSERRTIINGNRAFRFDCERCRLMRGAAFTLAEVLITLGIIGVVAALTIPAITANYRRQEMIGRLKKNYSVLSQAFVMSENENGLFTDWDTSNGKIYFEKYWKKYLKGVSDCKNIGCGYEVLFSDNVWRLLNGAVTSPGIYAGERTRKTAKLDDGTFLLFMVRTDMEQFEPVNRIYVDINGYKKPNTFGKDVFVFEFREKGLVPHGIDKTDAEINSDCKKNAYGGKYCAALLYKNGWEVPDNYPW